MRAATIVHQHVPAANRCVWYVLMLGFTRLFTILRHTGERASRPLDGAFPLLTPLAEFGVSARSFAGTPRADVWGGRGTVVVARAVRSRTIKPTPSGAY